MECCWREEKQSGLEVTMKSREEFLLSRPKSISFKEEPRLHFKKNKGVDISL